MADYDPSGSQNPLTNFDETWHGWVMSGITPHMRTLVGVALCGWSGHMYVITRLVTSREFFSFFRLIYMLKPKAHGGDSLYRTITKFSFLPF